MQLLINCEKSLVTVAPIRLITFFVLFLAVVEAYCVETVRSLRPLIGELTQMGWVEEALQVKRRVERIEDASESGPARISGRWSIRHCGGTEAVWNFNKDLTYNYWNDTETFNYCGGKYQSTHTWDCEIQMLDEEVLWEFALVGTKAVRLRAG